MYSTVIDIEQRYMGSPYGSTNAVTQIEPTTWHWSVESRRRDNRLGFTSCV